MLVALQLEGGFGNSYLPTAHVIASALENGFEFQTYSLAPFRSLLAEDKVPPAIRLRGAGRSAVQRFFIRCFRRIVRTEVVRVGRLTLVNERHGRFPMPRAALAAAAKKGTVIHLGWLFRDPEALVRRADVVREILRFKKELVEAVGLRLATLRKDVRTVIGVHVRRGDYREFRGGRFYFEDDVYLRIAQEAAVALGGAGGDVLVLGVSAEKLAWPARLGDCRIETVSGKFWEDLLMLAQCDLIIGPPSTFSGTASFIGNKPYFQISSPDCVFSLGEAVAYPNRGINAGV